MRAFQGKPLGTARDHCQHQSFETFGAFCSKPLCALLSVLIPDIGPHHASVALILFGGSPLIGLRRLELQCVSSQISIMSQSHSLSEKS